LALMVEALTLALRFWSRLHHWSYYYIMSPFCDGRPESSKLGQFYFVILFISFIKQVNAAVRRLSWSKRGEVCCALCGLF